MTNNLSKQWQPSDPEGLSRQFSRFGWIGIWIQLALLCIPILLLIYILFFSVPESSHRWGIDLGNYLSYGSLLVMVFTTFWFFRYTRLAKRIVDPEVRPPLSDVMRTLWVGLWASSLGILFSLLVMMSAVGRLLFVLMATPLTGVQIAAPGGDPTRMVSAIDAVSLMSLLVIVVAELIVMGLSLWLLFKVTRPSDEVTETT